MMSHALALVIYPAFATTLLSKLIFSQFKLLATLGQEVHGTHSGAVGTVAGAILSIFGAF